MGDFWKSDLIDLIGEGNYKSPILIPIPQNISIFYINRIVLNLAEAKLQNTETSFRDKFFQITKIKNDANFNTKNLIENRKNKTIYQIFEDCHTFFKLISQQNGNITIYNNPEYYIKSLLKFGTKEINETKEENKEGKEKIKELKKNLTEICGSSKYSVLNNVISLFAIIIILNSKIEEDNPDIKPLKKYIHDLVVNDSEFKNKLYNYEFSSNIFKIKKNIRNLILIDCIFKNIDSFDPKKIEVIQKNFQKNDLDSTQENNEKNS